MRRIIRYQVLLVPGKIRLEIKLTVDERSVEYNNVFNNIDTTALTLYPLISLSIVRPGIIDEEGRKSRAPWNPNDTIGMTKYTMASFASEVSAMIKDMKTPELYSYQGRRLELNELLAEKIRRPFMVGNIAVELSPVVITKDDDTRIEGVKMKFNNENSSTLLSLNDLDALVFNLTNTDVDVITMLMYIHFVKSDKKETSFDPQSFQSEVNVDIKPKVSEFD